MEMIYYTTYQQFAKKFKDKCRKASAKRQVSLLEEAHAIVSLIAL